MSTDSPFEVPPPELSAALLDLHRVGLAANEPDVDASAVESAVALTRSAIGYVHLVNEDQETLEFGAWSQGTLAHCTAIYERHYPLSAAGVWADCARHRRASIQNDYPSHPGRRGYPVGHAHVLRHLGVPALEGDEVRLLVGVGNKPAPYDDRDVRTLQALADETWQVIRAHRCATLGRDAVRQLVELQGLAHIGAFTWDPEEATLQWEVPLRRLFGQGELPAPAIGLDALLRLIDAEHHARLLELLHTPLGVRTATAELAGFRADGHPALLLVRVAAIPRPQGHGHLVRGIVQDLSEREELREVRHAAQHDALTGLANRAVFLDVLTARLTPGRRATDREFALHFVDLDRFKPINDLHGHAVGDEVLKAVARRLVGLTRKEDLVARLGGDELVVLQHGATGASAVALAEKIAAALRVPFRVGTLEAALSASVGIALPRPEGESAESLLDRADRAMYRAKLAEPGSVALDPG